MFIGTLPALCLPSPSQYKVQTILLIVRGYNEHQCSVTLGALCSVGTELAPSVLWFEGATGEDEQQRAAGKGHRRTGIESMCCD